MRALVQRVSSADVSVDGEVVGAIGTGLLALIGVTHSDTPRHARELARKVGGLRILDGERGVTDVPGAAVLAVSQFTLYGDVRKGRRPSWTAAAPGSVAAPQFDEFVVALRATGVRVHIGVFGARMRVRLTNEGPMTLLIDV